MTPMELLAPDDPILRQRAVEATSAWGLAHIASCMAATMRAEGGVGLAGPQVGVGVRMFVTAMSRIPVVINPVWTPLGDTTDVAHEGCLSVPGATIPLERYTSVRLTGRALDWSELDLELHGFPARLVQHETDHLDGVLIG